MKTIIAGSRGINNITFVKVIELCRWLDRVTVVISGTAKGVDTWGEYWAEWMDLPIMRFPADWKSYGKAAGHIRNKEMAEHADALIAIWDGSSSGTKNMIETAKRKGLRIFIWNRLLNECIYINEK